MKTQVKNSVSAENINEVRAALVIPIVITVICSTFDMIFQIRFEKVLFHEISEWLYWIFGTLISYFFPSFLASAISLLWQYYFAKSWSGIKEGKGLSLGLSTLFYFCIYIIYLLYSESFFIYIFIVINIIYVKYVLNRCLDEKILNNRITNEPS